MKRIVKFALALSVLAFTACEEWQPVFTGKYENPEEWEPVTMQANTTIAELKAMYGAGPVQLKPGTIITGIVISTDQPGNLYKSMYIQDETAGIEVKIGRNGLYNEYKMGQRVYIDCDGLTLGDYKGMKNLGVAVPKDADDKPTSDYETSYIEHPAFIDAHIFRGEVGKPLDPRLVAEADLSKPENIGCYVTIKDVVYQKKAFVLGYIDPNGDRKDYAGNCFFADEEYGTNFGIDSWALSELNYKKHLEKGCFDEVEAPVPSFNTALPGKVGSYKMEDGTYAIGTMPYSVSQYFTVGGTTIQVRSSGFAKFADIDMDERILNGEKFNLTGILTTYKGEPQVVLLEARDGFPFCGISFAKSVE